MRVDLTPAGLSLLEKAGIWAGIVGLPIAVIALIMSFVFGYGPWKERRQRPALELVHMGVPSGTSGSPRETTRFELGLRNHGRAPALAWRLILTAPPGYKIHPNPRRSNPGRPVEGEFYTQESDGSWRIEWTAQSDADVISPGADRPRTVGGVEAEYPQGQVIECRWVLSARGIRDRKGRLVTALSRPVAIIPD